MGNFGAIHGEGTVARSYSVDDIGYSPYDEHIHLQRKAPEKYGAILGGKLHTPDNPSHMYRPYGGSGCDK
jgi:hypothetical protein